MSQKLNIKDRNWVCFSLHSTGLLLASGRPDPIMRLLFLLAPHAHSTVIPHRILYSTPPMSTNKITRLKFLFWSLTPADKTCREKAGSSNNYQYPCKLHTTGPKANQHEIATINWTSKLIQICKSATLQHTTFSLCVCVCVVWCYISMQYMQCSQPLL